MTAVGRHLKQHSVILVHVKESIYETTPGSQLGRQLNILQIKLTLDRLPFAVDSVLV